MSAVNAFWTGMLIGAVIGMFVGSVVLIGQGLWSTARYWGYEQCKMEIRMGREP